MWSTCGVPPVDCPCGSGAAYAACCGPLHDGAVAARTAEQLMRSRFSAFALGDEAHLLATWHASTRPASLTLDPAIEWRRLRVLDTVAGTEDDETGTVEFVAFFWHATHRRHDRQHERSAFAREAGRWRYVGEAAA